MMVITQLSEEIKDLGQRVLELENGFRLKDRIDKREISPQDAYQNLFSASQLLSQFAALQKKNKIRVPIPDELVQSDDYPAILGLSVLGHDLASMAMLFQAKTMFDLHEYASGNKISEINKFFEDQNYFVSYENFRIGLNTIEYLATGNKKFVVPVSAKNVPGLLYWLHLDKIKCSYHFGDVKSISSDQYFAISQLVKNAVKWVYQAKRESPTPNSIDDTIDVRINETDTHLVATVKDNGTGILSDKLPLIFGGYTEGGTNVGLRVVKRILDLTGGYAEVVSTRTGKETFKYDTKTNTTLKIGENQPQGTIFTLYFPKS